MNILFANKIALMPKQKGDLLNRPKPLYNRTDLITKDPWTLQNLQLGPFSAKNIIKFSDNSIKISKIVRDKC